MRVTYPTAMIEIYSKILSTIVKKTYIFAMVYYSTKHLLETNSPFNYFPNEVVHI